MTTPDELERLAKAATPGDFGSADHTGSGSYECPCCDGDGQVEGKTFTNFDGYAMGVQFFGIGNEFANYEAFARAANPATILALLSERAELLAAVERMRGALMAAQSFIADGGLAETDPGASIYRQVTAALTTGEGK